MGQALPSSSDKSSPMAVVFGVPLGPELGPMLPMAYITPLCDITNKFGVSYLVYADDMFHVFMGEMTR